jgi:hypothetical protein
MVLSPTKPVMEALEVLLLADPATLQRGVKAAGDGAYESWKVPKWSGGWRRIDAPVAELKVLQRLILHRLLYLVPASMFAHGFVPGRSIVTNARVHVETARSVVSLDLQDAYPSVSAERVREALEWAIGPVVKSVLPRNYRSIRNDLFRTLATVCTHRGRLPQGAPTSGAILNLVCTRLDRQAALLMRRAGYRDLRYSRYADDLTFTSSDELGGDFTEAAVAAVLRSGFTVNRRKVERHSVRRRTS